jgi:hypothetical protein
MVFATTSNATIAYRNRLREVAADVRRETVAGHAAHTGAHHLDADHQRIGENNGPAKLVAELSTGLRVCRDAARIVVGRAGDQPGTEISPQFARITEHRRTVNRGPAGRYAP